MIENTHYQGILQTSSVRLNCPFHTKATAYLSKLMTHHNYVGTLAIEFFVINNQLIINECAPRVHNTGHWTIEGATTSQFENHIRAITGNPLGQTTTQKYPAMINIIGTTPPQKPQKKHIYYHDYGKEKQPGRKLGHITLVPPTCQERRKLIKQYQKSSFVL